MGTQGIETSQYLQEKKSIEMLLVTASENSIRQTESFAEMQRRCGVLVHVLKFLTWKVKVVWKDTP